MSEEKVNLLNEMLRQSLFQQAGSLFLLIRSPERPYYDPELSDLHSVLENGGLLEHNCFSLKSPYDFNYWKLLCLSSGFRGTRGFP
jgi:hypothetical protein